MAKNNSAENICRLFVVLFISGIICVRAECAEGFFNNSGKCAKCPIHCRFCNSTEKCLVCNNGYSGVICMKQCTNCKPNTSCTMDDGVCIEACKDGLSGQFCDKPCATRCRSCLRNDSSRCFTCKNNNTCELDCPEDCRPQGCNGNDGSQCNIGCSPEYWGESCSLKCPEDCNAGSSGDKVQDLDDASVQVLLLLIVTPLGVVLVILSVVLSVILWKSKVKSALTSTCIQQPPALDSQYERRSQLQENVESKTNHSDLWANMDDRSVDHEGQELNTRSAEPQAESD